MPEVQNQNRELVRRYTDQPARLPAELRSRIEAEWDGAPVYLYALADLNAQLTLEHTWVALGPERVALAQQSEDGEWELDHVRRDRIQAVRDAPGLSGSVLTLLGEPDQPALARVRFTHRQRRAMENLKFLLEEAVAFGPSADSPGSAAPDRERAPDVNADDEYARSVAGPIREAQALVSGNRMAVIWRLLGYLKPYRREVTIGFLAATVITLVSLIPPYLAGYLIDSVVRPVQDGQLSQGRGARIAWFAVAGMGLVYLVRQAGAVLRLRMMSVLGEWVARDLRTELYEHLQRLSLSFYARKKTGSLITRVSSDTDRLWDFLAFGVVDVSLSLVMLVGLSTVLLSLDWKLGLVMTVPVPLFCLAIYRHGESLNRVFVRAWRKWSRVTDVLSDTIPGMSVVKAFGQEDREKGRFRERNYAVTEEYNRIHHMWTTFWPLLMLAVHGTTVAVWAFAIPRLLETGETALSAGTFVSFLLYTTMFVAPIEVIGQMARTINRATSSAHRVFEVLDTEPEIVDVVESVRLDPVEGRVRFRDVTFGYDGVQLVLKGVNFEVQPGEMIGLVGPSGGGKTTIVSLLARFYEPTGGAIEIDGVDLSRLDTTHYRRQVGMVLQEPYLFHGTLLDNIRYGRPDADLEEVVEAARAANAHEFIVEMGQGYDTVVGERGQTLSGGQRQRVSIARAILNDPRILILDEATSAVDTETERKIQEAMDRLVAGRTTFAIAHRLSTLHKASRLFVVKNGRIAEMGTHTELLGIADGLYRRLHELQVELA